MNQVSVKTKIVLGLICLMASSMVIIYFTGLGPNDRAARMHGRAQLCENIAVETTLLSGIGDRNRLKAVLKNLIERNDDILSAGLQGASGKPVISVGGHFESVESASTYSTESLVRVPIRKAGKVWAELQIQFSPISKPGISGWVFSPIALYVVLVSMACYVSFSLFLGKVLKQLDPSNAVPRRVRSALDTLAEGLIVTDKKGNVILANEMFSKWVGESSEDLAGRHSSSFSWEDADDATEGNDGSSISFPWDVALQNQCPVAGHLMRFVDDQGRVRILIANASPVMGAEGDYRGVLTSFEDVTDLEHHKQELRIAKSRADQANQAKSEFLARMSHEIRTPMNAILGYTEVLLCGLDDPEKRERHLTTIQSSGEHLLSLINDILDLSKIEAGQLTLERSRFSLHQIISQCVSVMKIKANEKGIELQYPTDGPMPEFVFTDAMRLKQTLINLISNAIKFTEQGGVLVQPRLVSENEQPLVEILVADTGIGMTPEAQAKVFDPFAQADTTITRRFGGTGLGLSICKELAEKLGGSISVTSEIGTGSVFAFRFNPGDLTDVKLLQPDELAQETSSQRKDDLQLILPGARILVVDDTESNRELVGLFLRRAHMTFEMAENGLQALEKVQTNQYDAVLMDMQMPVMDGFTATRELRKRGFTLPIIALTANAMASDERDCLDAGCSGFLSKPIKRQALMEMLKDSLKDFECFEHEATQPVSSSSVGKTGSGEIAECVAEKSEQHKSVRCSLPMDDEDFVRIAQLFVASLEGKLQEIHQSLQEDDFEAFSRFGHWLKGAGGSAGFDDFSTPARAIESAALAEDLLGVRSELEIIVDLASRIEILQPQT